PYPLITFHDSDDTASPTRFQKLVRKLGKHPVAVSPHFMKSMSGRYRAVDLKPVPAFPPPLDVYFRMTTGLYRADFMRKIGGPHPEVRGSYDTTLTCLCVALVTPRVVPEPLYSVIKRPGSLTTDPVTGLKDDSGRVPAWRKQQKKLRRRLYISVVNKPV